MVKNSAKLLLNKIVKEWDTAIEKDESEYDKVFKQLNKMIMDYNKLAQQIPNYTQVVMNFKQIGNQSYTINTIKSITTAMKLQYDELTEDIPNLMCIIELSKQ